MKHWGCIPLLLLALALASNVCLAAEENQWCFSESEARKMLVPLEKAPKLEEDVSLLKEANRELEYQIKLLREVNGIRQEEIKQYKELMDLQKQGYESIIKNSKPNPLDVILRAVGFVGLGILLGFVL